MKGKTIRVDATTLEANAAMRSIVWRDDGRYTRRFSKTAKASGIETPRAKIWRASIGSERRGLERRLVQAERSRRQDHEDEGRADAPGPPESMRLTLIPAQSWQ